MQIELSCQCINVYQNIFFVGFICIYTDHLDIYTRVVLFNVIHIYTYINRLQTIREIVCVCRSDMCVVYDIGFNGWRCSLEALAVDDAGTGLVVLLLGDPHLLEGGEGSQDGASDPDGVLPLGGSNDLDLHGGRSQGGDLLLHAVSDTGVHGGASREDGVRVEILTDINVALHDGVKGSLMDTNDLHTQEGRLEDGLGAAETLVADGDDLSVGQLVGLLEGGGGLGDVHLILEVEGDVAELLLHVTDNLSLSGGHERITALGEDLHEVVGQVASGQVETQDGVGEGVTLVDRDGVGNTITGVKNDTGGTARGVQGEHGLDTDVHGGGVESLEGDLGHLLSVGLRVEGGLRVESGVLLGGGTQLVVDGVMPDLLHVGPVGHNAVLNGVLQGEDPSLGLSLVTNVGIFLSHADHDTDVTWATDDGREDGAGSVITGEAGLAHSGSIVHDQRSNLFVVAHFRFLKVFFRKKKRKLFFFFCFSRVYECVEIC